MRRRNPQLEMVYRAPDRVRRLEFDSAIRFSYAEPLRDRIRFLTGNRWFTSEDARASNPRFPIFIPDRMAETLGITAPMVDAQPVMVTINGGAFWVTGIFASDSLRDLRDLDGGNLLPFDIEQMDVLVKDRLRGLSLARPEDPRIPAHRVILTPSRSMNISILFKSTRRASIAVAMPETSYEEARSVIFSYMEQTGSPLYLRYRWGILSRPPDQGSLAGWAGRSAHAPGHCHTHGDEYDQGICLRAPRRDCSL